MTDQEVADEAEPTARRGEVGRQTYERVRALLEGGMSRSDAFGQVGEETGRKPGTVATAFYRIAREQPDGGGVRQRPRRARGAAAATASAAGNGRTSRQRGGGGTPSPSVDRLVADAHRSIDQLAAQLRELDGEVRQLRDQAGRYDRIRRMMSE